jgi:hypothetical protein
MCNLIKQFLIQLESKSDANQIQSSNRKRLELKRKIEEEGSQENKKKILNLSNCSSKVPVVQVVTPQSIYEEPDDIASSIIEQLIPISHHFESKGNFY